MQNSPPDHANPQPAAPVARLIAPLPGAVWLLVLLLAGVELVLQAGAHGLVALSGSSGWRAQALALAGVNPALQAWMVDTGQAPLRHLLRYLVFGFVNLGPLPVLLVVVITAALGKACAERIGSIRLLLILALSQAAGAFAFGMLADAGAWLIGGYPLIFALAGCYAAVLWQDATDTAARLRAISIPAALMLARIILTLLAGGISAGGMDWLADCVACLAGVTLGWLLRPGILLRLRRR